MGFHLIERLGGSCRCVTLLTFAIHFFHSLFSVITYLSWVRQETSHLQQPTRHAYLAMTVVCCVFYFLGASVFYMWAWRFPEPEEVAKRRRVYGVIIHVLFCDVPMFVVETKIVWQVRFAAAIFGFTYCLTCVSLCYSLLRVWFFSMVRVIKFRMPTAARLGANYPALSGMARRGIDEQEYHKNNNNNNSSSNTNSGGGGGVGNYYPGERNYYTNMNDSGMGETILLNRNAAMAYSEDAASAGMYTPRAADRGSRGSAYYGPSAPAHYAPPPLARYADPAEMQPRGGYYGQGADHGNADTVPFRI